MKELAASEMIGVIALTGIIIATITIIGSQWIAFIPTSSMPHVQMEIACGDGTIPGDFSCRTGVIGCSPDEIPLIPLGNCSYHCSKMDRSQFQECYEKCLTAPNCADIRNHTRCNMIFICHMAGDSLNIANLNISINGKVINKPYTIYNYAADINITNKTTGSFNSSELIRIPISEIPDNVMIIYNDYGTGQNLVLINKKFR